MSATKSKSLGGRADDLIEAAVSAIHRAGGRLVKRYYDGVDRLRAERGMDGFVKLHFMIRRKGNSVELRWYNRHPRGGARGFETIPKPRGSKDYNLSVLRANGLEEMQQLIDETELQARGLRTAAARVIEAARALESMQTQLMALSPDLIAAMSNTDNDKGLAAKQSQLDLMKL